jgi:hypothetical protein
LGLEDISSDMLGVNVQDEKFSPHVGYYSEGGSQPILKVIRLTFWNLLPCNRSLRRGTSSEQTVNHWNHDKR